MENFIAYQKARYAHYHISSQMRLKKLNAYYSDQLERALASMLLNIAEGNGRNSKKDKARFFSNARGSVYEISAILDILMGNDIVSEIENQQFRELLDEVSRILTALINGKKREH